jgi:hypothetical protein
MYLWIRQQFFESRDIQRQEIRISASKAAEPKIYKQRYYIIKLEHRVYLHHSKKKQSDAPQEGQIQFASSSCNA